MFEYKIQKAWDNYKLDFGLGRSLLLISIYNLFLFFLSATSLGGVRSEGLYPLYIALLFFFFRSKIIKLSSPIKLAIAIIPLLLAIILNYYLVGEFDRAIGFERKDNLFAPFDQWIFGSPAALAAENFLAPLGLLRSLFYDVLMLSYMSYFLLPLVGLVLLFKQLPEQKKYKIGRYIVSVLIFFFLNYLLYMLVPVTGPQYWMSDIYTHPLPFTVLGHFLWGVINQGQTTFIDCFPSGHTGVAVLVTLWLFKGNHPARFLFLATTGFIIMATLMLRYHYLMDIICTLPLAYFALKISWTVIPESLNYRDMRGL